MSQRVNINKEIAFLKGSFSDEFVEEFQQCIAAIIKEGKGDISVRQREYPDSGLEILVTK